MKVNGKGIRNIEVILAIALVSLLIVSAYEVMNNGHEVKWQFQLPDDYYYIVHQATDGTIYVAGSEHGLYALNPDGTLKFSHSGAWNPVVSSNGTAYFGTVLPGASSPSLCALSANNHIEWSVPVANGSFSTPVIGQNGTIYTVHDTWGNGRSYGSEFMAVSPHGDLLSKWTLSGYTEYIVSQNGTLLTSTYDGNLTAYGSNGSVLWKVPFPKSVQPWLANNDAIYGVENVAYVEGQVANLCAISTNGSVLWRYPGTSNTSKNVQLSCGQVRTDELGNVYFIRQVTVNVSQFIDIIYAINPNGTQRWNYTDESMGVPSLNAGKIVFGTGSGFTILDLNGHLLWKMNLQSIGNTLWIGNDGTVYTTASNSVIAIGENPIVLEIGALISLPIIAICFAILWKAKKNKN